MWTTSTQNGCHWHDSIRTRPGCRQHPLRAAVTGTTRLGLGRDDGNINSMPRGTQQDSGRISSARTRFRDVLKSHSGAKGALLRVMAHLQNAATRIAALNSGRACRHRQHCGTSSANQLSHVYNNIFLRVNTCVSFNFPLVNILF